MTDKELSLVELEKQFEGDMDLMLFFVSYIKNGLKASFAYRELHPDVTAGSAEVGGSRMLSRVKEKIGIQAVMALYGLDLDLYLKQLKDGNLADKWNDFTGEREADHKTREAYHTKLGKILGIESEKGTTVEAKILVMPSELIEKYGITPDTKDSSKG